MLNICLIFQGTMSSDKNELLYKEFEINYNNLSAIHRKGTILVRAAKVRHRV